MQTINAEVKKWKNKERVVTGVISILDVVGNTPLIKVGNILAKLETTNPTGSVKDRMAWHLIKKAEEKGELNPGSEIIEVTSGNTGIAFAMISAARGYKFTAVMSESMSIERRRMMNAFGAEIILTPAEEDIAGAIRRYNELVKERPNAWLPKQFENPENMEAHELGLGKEIAEQTDGKQNPNSARTSHATPSNSQIYAYQRRSSAAC